MLADLIALLEAATRPDSDLDKRVFAYVDGWSYPLVGAAIQEFKERMRWDGETRYTASLDAALTLVPEGWEWAAGADLRLFHGAAAWARVFPVGEQQRGTGNCLAAAPALALCIAALKARAADGGPR
jgi:hypothetical protein